MLGILPSEYLRTPFQTVSGEVRRIPIPRTPVNKERLGDLGP
jgi:hypothetical protein